MCGHRAGHRGRSVATAFPVPSGSGLAICPVPGARASTVSFELLLNRINLGRQSTRNRRLDGRTADPTSRDASRFRSCSDGDSSAHHKTVESDRLDKIERDRNGSLWNSGLCRDTDPREEFRRLSFVEDTERSLFFHFVKNDLSGLKGAPSLPWILQRELEVSTKRFSTCSLN